MLEWQLAGQNRRMRRQRERRMRVGAFEDDGLGRERIDRGCSSGRAAVRLEIGRPQTVDGNEDDRSLVRCRFARVPPAGDRRGGDGATKEREYEGGLPAAR